MASLNFDQDSGVKGRSFSRREHTLRTGISILLFLLGIYLTFLVLESLYGDNATSQLLKGISILNLIDIILETNLAELIILIYFLVLIGILLLLDKVLIGKGLKDLLSLKQSSSATLFIHAFREGSFTIPVLIMIGSPTLLQVILPAVVVFIAVVELLFPFAILGEIYNVSEENLLKLVSEIPFFRKNSSQDIHIEKQTITSRNTTESSRFRGRELLDYVIMIVYILIFPIVVAILLVSGMDRFLNLIYFNLLWENTESSSQIHWIIINGLINLISFNIDFLSTFLLDIKYFVLTAIVLVLTSKIYFIVKNISGTRIMSIIENNILRYQ
ncbi:MAG: hypothetical protein ACFFE8_16540 [Candidatus Heimdallarchaeota archaeon]